MAENNISIKVQADVNGAKAALRDLQKQVQESGRTQTQADRDALSAAKARVRETNAVARAERDLGILGVRSQREIKAEMDKVTAAMDKLRKNFSAAGTDIARASEAAKEKMSALKQEMDGGVKTTDKLRESWGKLAALAGSLAVFGIAAKQAIEFEDALVDLHRAANTSKDEAEAMGKEFKSLAEDLGLSATAVVQLATAAAKTGIAKNELVEFARVAATAAMNFDMLPEEAGDALAGLKVVLKLGVKDMEEFAGAVNMLADNAAASERAIIEALKLGGGSATQFGLSAKQAAALATAFLNVKASAEQSGTAMRTMLGRLRLATTDTKTAGAALQSIVGDTRKFAQVMAVDASGALNTFMAALSKMPAAERFQALHDLFGEGLDTENITKLSEALDDYTRIMGMAGTSSDVLVKSLRDLTNVKMETTASAINQMSSAAKNAGESLGKIFLPAIKAGAYIVRAFADAVQFLADNFPKLTLGVAGLAAFAAAMSAISTIGPVVVAVLGKLGVTFAAGSALAAAAGVAVRGFAAALGILTGPVGWVAAGLLILWDAWNLFGKDNSAKKSVEAQRKAFEEVSLALRGIGTAAATAKNQISQAMNDAKAPIENLAKGYKDISEGIKASLTERITNIDAAAQRETQIMQANHLGQRAQIQETARIMLESETKKLQAVDQAGEQMLAAWERTYGQAMAIERAAGVKGSALAAEARDAKIGIYQQIEAAYKSTIDKLIAEEQRNLAAVKAAEQERLMLKMSVEDKLRALKQKTMTDEQAYADRVKQIDDKLAAARDANAKGNVETAKQLWNEAISLAQSNANAVTKTVEANGKSTQQTVVTLEKAVETSSAQIQQAYQGLDGQLAATAQTGAQSAGALNTQAQSVTNQWAEVKKELEALRAEKAVEIDATLTANTEAARTAIDQLRALGAAESVQIKLDADVAAANASLAAWKDDPTNKDLKLEARVDQAILATTVANLKTSLEAAKLQAPTDLNVQKAQETFAALTKTLNEAETKSTHTVEDNVPEAMGNLEDLNAHNTDSSHTVKDNAAKVQAAIDKLKHNTSSTHTIYIKKVEKNATGGLVGGYASGGLIQRLAEGGAAFRRMIGRISGPGTGTSDSIPAMLSNGEFVIRAAMVRKWGASFFEALNRGMMPPVPKYATGGAVNVPLSMSGSSEALTVTFRAGDLEAPVKISDRNSRESMKAFARELQKIRLVQG